MISIEETKNRLPNDALDSFQRLFTPSQFNSLVLAFRQRRKTTFRINTLKATRPYVLKELNKLKLKFINIPFIDNAFSLREENNRFINNELVKRGELYLQSLASQIVPLVLSPQEGDTILDIAAAPGSKTTQLSAIMGNSGKIDAVEPDIIRLERLKYNCSLLEAKNIFFHNADGQSFCKGKENSYDKVLADLPCSGEGRFNIYDKKSYGLWKARDVSRLSKLQKKLLKSAVLSAKIGGVIVYSTCTLNVQENEMVLDAILNDNDLALKVMPIKKEVREIEEAIPPMLSFENTTFNPSVKNALRIMPSSRMEGFFISKLMRVG